MNDVIYAETIGNLWLRVWFDLIDKGFEPIEFDPNKYYSETGNDNRYFLSFGLYMSIPTLGGDFVHFAYTPTKSGISDSPGCALAVSFTRNDPKPDAADFAFTLDIRDDFIRGNITATNQGKNRYTDPPGVTSLKNPWQLAYDMLNGYVTDLLRADLRN